MNKRTYSLLAVTAALSMQGCAVVDHTIAKADRQQESQDFEKKFDATVQRPVADAILDNEGIWVNKRSVSMKEEQLPAMFRMPLNLGFETAASMRDFANLVQRETGVRISFAPDILQEADVKTLAAGYRSGDITMSQVLDQLTARNNMNWRYRGGSVEVFRFDTQVFQIAVLPGSADVSDTMGNSTGGGGGAGSSLSSSDQTVKFSAKVDFWKALSNDLKNIMSRDGANGIYTVSDATNTVTVTGTPQTLLSVESYLKQINANRSRQVALEVHAYTIDVQSGRDFGMSWNLAYTKMAAGLGLSSVLPPPANTALGTLTAILSPSSSSKFANSEVMLNALSTLGHTNEAISHTQMVPSGEVATVNSMRQINYLSKVTTSAVANAGTQTSLEQSTVKAGFSLTMMPVVVNGDTIMIRGLLDLSSIDGIDTVSSGGQSIATPKLSSRALPMTVYLKSGETYVYGLRDALNMFNDSGISGTALINTLTGGQHASSESRKTVVVTVTPHIVNLATR